MTRTPGLLEPPASRPALESELRRLEREQAATRMPQAIRLLALERRRVIIALDALSDPHPSQKMPMASVGACR